MKIRNRELKTELSIGFEVVTNLYSNELNLKSTNIGLNISCEELSF